MVVKRIRYSHEFRNHNSEKYIRLEARFREEVKVSKCLFFTKIISNTQHHHSRSRCLTSIYQRSFTKQTYIGAMLVSVFISRDNRTTNKISSLGMILW